MNKKKILLLPLLALTLVGCDSTKSNSVKSTSVSDQISQTSQKQSVNSSTTKKDSTTSDGKKSDSTKSEATTNSSASTSTSVDEYEASKWPTKVKDAMVENLNGAILPYIDLGTSNILPSYDKKTLTLLGGMVSMTTDRLNTAKTTYNDAGWETEIKDSKMVATNAAKGFTVTFYEDKLDDSDGILILTCVYDEPFDINNATTDWKDDVKDILNTNILNHGEDIPYVYLGTSNPTASWAKSTSTVTITGGKWDDSIITTAQTTFNSVNSSITDVDHKWDINVSLNTSSLNVFTAEIEFADKAKVLVTITTPSTTIATRTAKMTIKYTEPFDPNSATDWPADMKTKADDNFDGHFLPFFYTATANPTFTYTTTSRTMYITGGTWDSQVLTLAKTALTQDDANETNSKYKWSLTEEQDKITAEKTYMDGCGLTATITKNSSSKVYITVKYTQGYIAPDGYTAWDSTITSLMTANLNGTILPYVYLNTALTTKLADTGSWAAATSTLTITGGTWYDAVLNGAYGVFSKAGWTARIETEDGYKTESMYAEKVLDATKGEKIVVKLRGSTTYTTSTSNSGNCKMTVVYYCYDAPTGDDAKWSDATETHIKTYLGGHTIPYFYMNEKCTSTKDVSLGKGTGYVTLTGGLFIDNLVMQACQTSFATWDNPTVNSEGTEFTATHTESDGCKLSISVSKNSSNKIFTKVTINESYVAGLTTSYSDEIKAKISTGLVNHEMPFVDLGTTSISVSSTTATATTHYATLTTAVWDDAIFTNAESAFTTAGWTYFYDDVEDDSTKTLYAYIVNSDNSSLLAKIAKGSATGNNDEKINTCTYTVYYYTYVNSQAVAKTAWTTAETTFLNSNTQNHADDVPFFDMGGGEDDYKTTASSGSANPYITGTEFDYASVLKYITILKNKGYKITSVTVAARPTFKATYENTAEGYTISLSLTTVYTNSKYLPKLEISYATAFNIPTGDDAKWTTEVEEKAAIMIGDDSIKLPFVYLGTLDNYKFSTITSSSKYVTITGGAWDDRITDLALTAFTNAASDGWTVFKTGGYDGNIVYAYLTTSTRYIKVTIKATSNKATLQIQYKLIS